MKSILKGILTISAVTLLAICGVSLCFKRFATTGFNIRPREQITDADEVRSYLQTKEASSVNSSSSSDTKPFSAGTSEWKCCINAYEVNELKLHPLAEEAQDEHHNYACPENPSNFSWYYSPSSHHPSMRVFKRWKWQKKSFLFAGGSTTRQMYEQFRWEMPFAAQHAQHNYAARFLFHLIEVGGCCNYDRSHILDLRRLQPDLVEQIKAGPDFVVFNVGLWWGTKAIGRVIDGEGQTWSINGTRINAEWRIANKTTVAETMPMHKTSKPDFSFAKLMRRAIGMMMEIKPPNTTLVWRSEGTTDCPPGSSFRGSIAPILQQKRIPVLNISEATCDYLSARNSYDQQHKGAHLCFPSVALRHWLLQFQDQFL